MDVVILGCGRIGARLANVLSASHRTTIIDWNRAAFERLDADYAGRAIVGNGIDIDTLREAGADTADVFIAVTDGDNRNIMAGEIADQLGAGKVIVRVYDANRAEIYADTGLTTICPTIISAERLFRMVVRPEE